MNGKDEAQAQGGGEVVAALQSMRDRMMAALPPKFGDAFDGDFDTMLEAIRALKKHAAPPSAPVGVTPECLSALRSYQQADAEGVMVTVSRQALDEVIAALAQQPASITRCDDCHEPTGSRAVCEICADIRCDAVSKQPAAVDGALEDAILEVAESINRFRDEGTRPHGGTLTYWESTLRRALAAQPGGSDND